MQNTIANITMPSWLWVILRVCSRICLNKQLFHESSWCLPDENANFLAQEKKNETKLVHVEKANYFYGVA